MVLQGRVHRLTSDEAYMKTMLAFYNLTAPHDQSNTDSHFVDWAHSAGGHPGSFGAKEIISTPGRLRRVRCQVLLSV